MTYLQRTHILEIKKSLYSLCHAPSHWYKHFLDILQSLDIGLKPTPHDPCIFYGTIIPGKAPVCVPICMDDFLFFSLDDEVEQNLKFDWPFSTDANVRCRISQECYAVTIVEEMGLSKANKSPLTTPFHSGLPVHAIPDVDMSPEACAPLTAKIKLWLGMINWLQM